jgi:ATP-dependent DNA helicase PIF1
MADALVLDDAQRVALEAVKAGKNVFITGPAGVGKSLCLDAIRDAMPTISVTATTGVAAVNVKGVTIHSWAGLGIGKDSVDALVTKLEKQIKFARYNKKKTGSDDCAGNRILRAKTLVIDEISMMPHALFYKLDAVCRRIRKRADQPFGGIQMIVVGDFFQLPPVHKDRQLCDVCGSDAVARKEDGLFECTAKQDWRCRNKTWDGRLRFCFDKPRDGSTSLWDKCHFTFVELTRVHRQTNAEFVALLHRIRVGEHTTADADVLMDACENDTLDMDDGILPTELYCHNVDVDVQNMTAYLKLDADLQEMVYEGVPSSLCTLATSKDHGRAVPDSRLLQMLMKNCPAPGELLLKIGAQVMLIHNMDVKVGLCNGTRGVVTGFVRAMACVSPKAADKSVRQLATAVHYWPKVKFAIGDGRHIVTVVKNCAWEAKTSVETAAYNQIPLKHAWAITVHKSQGMSLSRVRMHLEDAFSEGQVYVALSRATGMEGCLHIPGFDPEKIKVNENVVAWYKECRKSAPDAVCGSATVDELPADAGEAPRKRLRLDDEAE